ncbi:MAG: F0F1 ATP synthase subunit B [Pirellulaceae bacterium]|nr:F0F1 ATP synthase subunit B [Pirellulaceae bacterium]
MYKLRLVAFVALAAFSFVLTNVNAQDGDKPKAEVAKETEVSPEAKADAKHDEHDDHAKHEIDPTHSNMTDVGEDPAEWRSEKAIATLIVFGLLLLGLSTVAWKPIAAGLEKRERDIATNIKNAEQAAKDAAAKLVEYEAKLAAAAQEAQQIVADARKDAEAAGQRLLASAQEEAARQRDRAVADIESAKRVALNELAQQSTEVAMSLAQRIVGREVKAGDHQGMIQDMLKQLPSKN